MNKNKNSNIFLITSSCSLPQSKGFREYLHASPLQLPFPGQLCFWIITKNIPPTTNIKPSHVLYHKASHWKSQDFCNSTKNEIFAKNNIKKLHTLLHNSKYRFDEMFWMMVLQLVSHLIFLSLSLYKFFNLRRFKLTKYDRIGLIIPIIVFFDFFIWSSWNLTLCLY